MSTPSPRERIPSRLRAVFSRKWSAKDVVLIVLALLLVSVSAYAFKAPLAAAFAKLQAGDAETVSVFDVVVDRENRQYFDIVFDKSLGTDKVGTVLDPAPAMIEPGLGGAWTWRDTNALRFQPSGGLPIASEYTVTLKPETFLPEGMVLTGDEEITVRTDQFLVEGVELTEEPALEGKARVLFRGQIRFNYAVDPKVLIAKMRLHDPAGGEPLALELETDWNAPVISFRTPTIQKEREERKLRLVIAQDLTPVGGNVPLKEEFVHEIPLGSSTKLAVWGFEVQPGPRESTVVVRFSSPISAAVAEKYLKIEPNVRTRLSANRNELVITGDMKPGSSYDLTIGKGMPGTDEAVLSEEYKAKVAVPDLEPSAAFQSEGMFLSASGNRTVNVESVNVPKVRMAIDRVYRNNLFFLFNYGGFFDEDYGYFGELPHALGDRLREETLTVGGNRNQRRVTPITLDRWVDLKDPGLYRISVGKPDDWEAEQRWLLLTDMGIVAKRNQGEIMVWVASVRDLSPVSDAKVTLVSDQNQPMAEGRTDGSGIWRASDLSRPDKPGPDKRRPYLITVEKGDDFTFLLLDRMSIDTTGLDTGGDEVPTGGYTAFLYGERDLYRPGETAEGLAIVRDSNLRVPPAMPALLRHRDPQGKEVETERLQVDARGLAEWKLDLPAYSLTGHHTLELEVAEQIIGTYRFQVEEFVPDRISVEIQPPKEKVGPGQELVYNVASSYLFGAPAANLPVETRVRLMDSTFTAKGFEAYSFRNDERKMMAREVLETTGKLNEEGRSEFRVTMPEKSPVPSSLEAVLTARVQEQGGRGVAALTRLQVHPYPYYIGLRQLGNEEGWPEPKKPVELEYVAVSPEGKAVPSGYLRADFFEDRYNTVLRRTSGGGYRYESTREAVLLESKPIPAGKPKGTFRFTPTRYGSYRVVLTDPDSEASAQVEFYAAGWGMSPWAIKNPARLELDLDKEEYAPGDTAVVQVRAPFAGKLLVTVERDRVMDTQIHELTGNTATIQVPIRGDYRPNAFITATLVRRAQDLEPGSAGRAFGAVPLPVDRVANKLTPQITQPKEIRPNSKLEIGVKTTPGAVVTVAAVDEGILQLIAQKTPQPFDWFYRRLGLSVTSYDTFSLLMPEVKPQGKAPAGGGEGEEGMAQYVRTEGIRRVEPVAFWSGPLTADGEGNVKVSFQVPELQSALRVMVVAIDGPRFGSAEGKTRVRDPLVLLPTLPRILSFDETLQVPVTVRNDTAKPGQIQVGLAAQGPVSIEGQATQSVEIPVGRERTVYFTVKTGTTEGNVRFTATASGNGEQSRSVTNVGIRADLPEVSVEDAGGVAKTSMDLASPEAGRFRPETVRRKLRVGPLPLIQFAGKLEHLLHYPYGCLEQTVSSAFPLIYLGDLAKAFEPELFDPKKGHGDPADMVQAGLRRMTLMQLSGGGFSLWPGGTEVHPWASTYAAHFLVEARKAGHPVDENLYRGGVEWVAATTKAKSAYGYDDLQRTVYGLYVLARAGRPDLGTMDHIRTKHGKDLHAETRALLAAAYGSAGNPRAVQELVSRIGQLEEVQRQTGGNFNSTIRNRALLLLALLDAAPTDSRIPALADRLGRDAREIGWWTTQEESFTLLALGQLANRQAKFPSYSGSVFVGGKKVGTFKNQTATFTIRGTEPVRIQMDGGYQPGAAFYSILTRGIPTDEGFKVENNGMEIERRFLNRDGNAIDLNNVKQGDLIVIETRLRSVSGPLNNVAVVNLLPSGLEVENPRLQTTEQLPWATGQISLAYLDLRDDRILVFADLLPPDSWQTYYTLVRAVAPGGFRLPPVHAEAMYSPATRATGERGRMEVKTLTP
ncbi:MAG TPA: MG2 domain-containing protein [Thermoanaerobaculia bacterium]|nr:MG2 domain-containing protein [Thermoanaerobaculia bacterium]